MHFRRPKGPEIAVNFLQFIFEVSVRIMSGSEKLARILADVHTNTTARIKEGKIDISRGVSITCHTQNPFQSQIQ